MKTHALWLSFLFDGCGNANDRRRYVLLTELHSVASHISSKYDINQADERPISHKDSRGTESFRFGSFCALYVCIFYVRVKTKAERQTLRFSLLPNIKSLSSTAAIRCNAFIVIDKVEHLSGYGIRINK
uniref:Uncharacterized protein n=1 Tax=Glossina austeni TaxID=7395 RepID=A0A1A9V7T6_GLOAU